MRQGHRAPRVRRREWPNPDRGGESSGGRQPQESTGRQFLVWPRRGACGTDPRGEQSFEAGVPVVHGEPGVRGEWTERAACLRVRRGDWTSGREEPSSRLSSWRDRGKRTWRSCGHRAGCGRNFEPARKQRLARASTAPRGGKALEGQLLDASGMKQGREASGSQNRREGQEPWGRHRRGSGRSSSRTGETRASAERSSRKRGTRRSCVREKEPHERRPGRGNRKGGDEALELWRGPEPHEGRSCDQNRATKVWRGIPRGRKDDVGGAPKPIGRYSSGTIKTLKGTDTSREWSSARVTARGSERRI